MVVIHRLSWHHSLVHEDVNKALQRFHIFLREQVVVHGDSDEVHEAAIQLQVSIDVPEGVVPVAVIEMGVASEHLLDDRFHVLL